MVSSSSVVAGELKASFLYTLSNFTGPIPCSWVNLSVDREKSEIYVVDSRRGDVRVFNEKGMEVYRFGDDESLGTILDLAVDRDGSIFVLSRGNPQHSIIRCDYRGEPMSRVEIKNLPSGFSVFSPDRIVYREGRLYLADRDAMRVAVTGINGLLEEAYDIAALLEIEEKKRDDVDIVGFGVDGEGNILFTIPVLFKAFMLSPDGEITGFGDPGSSPGKFNIVGGIARDDMGYYYVTDTLRSVVMIFDKDLNFQTEFGYRGYRRDNLLSPKNLALDASGRLYVSQLKDRGVSVFRITHN